VPENHVLLSIKNISKEYPGVQALKNVSFDIDGCEIHAVVGENGAGKSTLMKILSGVEKKTSGEIFLDKRKINLSGIKEAKELGINLISQELNIVPDISAYENIFIGSEINKYGFVNRLEMKKKSRELLKMLGTEFSIDAPAGSLSVAEQQQIEIARALRYNGNILIMDEPTASLSEKETVKLFKVIRKLRDKGLTIIFISHRLSEVIEIADAVTVLRDGCYIGTLKHEEIDEHKIVYWMVGRELSDYYQHSFNENISDEPYFIVNKIGDNKRVFDVSFSAKKGEILCLAGLVGAGRTELCQLIFGINKKETGEIILDGNKLQINKPPDAIKQGIGYVPEDRKNHGLFLELSCANNIIINIADQKEISRGGIINLQRIKKISEEAIKSLNIRTPSIDKEVLYLSGGNQQKVLLARWLEISPKILILDESTHGIDVGAKKEIYELIGKLVVKGVTIIFISSDLPEVIGIAQRILVMREGRIVSEIKDRKEFTQENILAYASGIKKSNYKFYIKRGK